MNEHQTENKTGEKPGIRTGRLLFILLIIVLFVVVSSAVLYLKDLPIFHGDTENWVGRFWHWIKGTVGGVSFIGLLGNIVRRGVIKWFKDILCKGLLNPMAWLLYCLFLFYFLKDPKPYPHWTYFPAFEKFYIWVKDKVLNFVKPYMPRRLQTIIEKKMRNNDLESSVPGTVKS